VKKELSQKFHYTSHKRRKTSCENNADKIKVLVNVEDKLNKTKMIVDNEEVNINTKVMEKQLNQHTPAEKIMEHAGTE